MNTLNVEKALDALRQGQCVVVVDDEGRENEGDLVMAAELATPESVNFMAQEARGLICAPVAPDRLEAIGSRPMTAINQESKHCAFEISVDARHGISTGISAADRAHTLNLLADPHTTEHDFVRPGHIFPLRAREGGVLVRAGHTEAAVDLARLAGLQPAGVICEIMNQDGTMARRPELIKFAARHNLVMLTVEELIQYRRRSEKLVRKVAEADFPTSLGHFKLLAYESLLDGAAYLAIVKGRITSEPILVRVHSGCVTGDCLFSARCDCGEQLQLAMQRVEAEGRGVVLYIPDHEGRGIGLLNKIKAYHLQDEGEDTVEANEDLGFAADLRDFGLGAQVLADLGVRKMRLMTNNPRKLIGLSGYGLEVEEQIPLQVQPNEHNLRYLATKQRKMGHRLGLPLEEKEEKS